MTRLFLIVFAFCLSCQTSAESSCVSLNGRWGANGKEWGQSNVVWRTFKAAVPAEWKGRRVRVEIPGALHKCDAVIWVNGEKAGDILRPGFEGVEATRLVKFGADNEIKFCLTESGAETARGETKMVTRLHRAKKGPAGDNPKLAAYPDAFISDVFANTSWRRRRCDFEVEVDAASQVSRLVSVEVFDSATNLVWKGKKEIEAKAGRTVYVISMPWDEKIVAWEFGRPALYTCRTRLGDSVRTFRFGFREVWREGREIMMNGHKTHFRPVYGSSAGRWGRMFLQGMGFNMTFRGHSADAIGMWNEDSMDISDELGMGVMATVGSYDTLGADMFHKDPAMREEFRRFTRVVDRKTRNHPCLIVGIVGNMTKTDQGFWPSSVGQRRASGDRAAQIELAREIHRETNPNILYMSHADGPVADIDNGNVYFCWTPIQEQEEFLCQWTTNGTMPWCSIEFLSPYGGDWFKRGVFLGTEYLAALYGDRAYREESADALAGVAAATAGKGSMGHGSREGAALRDGKLPLWRNLSGEWTWRNNSRWRAFGLGGGNMWFDIGVYGTPPNAKGNRYQVYGSVTEKDLEGGGKPSWASWLYDVRRKGNLDFCGFIGGAPDFADRTHAYYAGEKIEKQLVLIWDGVGDKTVKAQWKLSTNSNCHNCPQTANENVLIPQGEQARVPISFIAPDVKEKTSYRLVATFTGEGIEPFTDTFEFEVWPRGECKVESAKCKEAKVALVDPMGEGAKVLDALGVKYVKIERPDELPADATHLVVGRDALEKMSIDSLAPRVEKGLRVFIMRQTPETWRKMGFRVQDLMLREVFARDAAFKSLREDALRYWRGAPDYPNGPFGRIMSHPTQRGPRGTRRHTVAGVVLQIPERVGYLPLVVGGFDLNFASLLRFEAGGDVTYCTMDFEGRIGSCPAATATAKAVFGEFLGNAQDGKSGNDFELVVCDEERAKAEGFAVGAETTILRASIPECAAFRGVGLGDVRWPSGISIKPLKGAGATPDGAFAVKRVGGKTLVFSQVPEGRFAARAAKRDQKKEKPMVNAEHLDEGRVRRLYARLRTNCGNATNLDLRKALHKSGAAEYGPLPSMHLLGPFSAGKDNSKLMLDTVWSEKGEEMAIQGDFDPNHEFALPQGGTANWRPMLAPNAEGIFDFTTIQPVASFPVTYAICHVERKTAGDAILKLGGDWRFKVWCNGKEVFRAESGARIPRLEVRVLLKAGDNTLSFKVGAGSSGHKLIALLAAERDEGAGEERDAELDAMTLYDDDIMGFDPYEFHYW